MAIVQLLLSDKPLRRRILFLIPTLNLGGAERSLVKAASHLTEEGLDVSIGVLCKGAHDVRMELPSRVKVFHLGARASGSPRLWWKVRRLIVMLKPDTVCGWSMYANLVAAVATIGLPDIRLAISERNFLPRMLRQPSVTMIRRFILKSAIRLLYRRAHIITANSSQSLCALRRYIGGEAAYVLLPNLVDIARLEMLASAQIQPPIESKPGLRIACVGRLDHQKGFDLMLKAIAQAEALCACHVIVVGEGSSRAYLEKLRSLLRFQKGEVVFLGSTPNPFPYYRWADIVVVPSRFEGFPNVALEAMALGKPIIAAKCQSGPAELTCRGRFGILIRPNDSCQLADALISASMELASLNSLGNDAREHVRTTYVWDAVKRSYLTLLA